MNRHETQFQTLCSYGSFPSLFQSNLGPYFSNFNSHLQNVTFYQVFTFWNQSQEEPITSIKGKTTSQQSEIQIGEQTSAGSKVQEQWNKAKKKNLPRFRPTKNNESNISNQAFSFMTTKSKSRAILAQFLQNKKKTEIFYEYARLFIYKRKKYMSKSTLLKLCTFLNDLEDFQQFSKLKTLNILSLKQFESAVCYLILYFLKHKSVSSILTSQKINSNLKKDHINKIREIIIFIEDNIRVVKKQRLVTFDDTIKDQI